MNQLEYQALEQDLTDHNTDHPLDGIRDITRIQRWLLDESDMLKLDDNDNAAARVAQSLVTRGDCELFGVTYPRFAYRVHLDRARTMYLNVRRLPALCRQVGEKYGSSWADLGEVADTLFAPAKHDRTPREELVLSSFVADSLLRRPFLKRGYHVLEASLGREMGEEQDSSGTPFSMGLALGGLCAPNACFMAGTLMHRWAAGAFAVGEVAALIQSTVSGGHVEKYGTIPLSEFLPNQFGSYFRHPKVGLNCSYQISSGHYGTLKAAGPKRNDYLKNCLRPYIMSGFPVIMQVSFRRMCHVYDQNRYRGLDDEAISYLEMPTEESDHAIAIVGCARTKGENNFIINDPACICPLLEAGAHHLDHAASGSQLINGKLHHSKPRFFPVTPRAITVPFEFAVDADEADASIGVREELDSLVLHNSGICLMDLVQYVSASVEGHYIIGDEGLPTVASASAFFEDEFRLLTYSDLLALGDDTQTLQPRPELCLERFDRAVIGGLVSVLQSLSQPPNAEHWFWMHLATDAEGNHSAWLWDAEFSLASTSDWKKVLVAAFSKGHARSGEAPARYLTPTPLENFEPVLPPAVADVSAKSPARRATDWSQYLRPSVITSFSARGIAEAVAHDPWIKLDPRSRSRHGRCLDIYCFMQQELGYFDDILAFSPKRDPHSPLQPNDSIYAYCARHADDEVKCAEMAQRIANACKGTKITGVATYLPEIISLSENLQIGVKDEQKRHIAARALIFILNVCDCLRDMYNQDLLEVVEIVAGSQIGGITPVRRWHWKDGKIVDDGDTIFVAHRTNPIKSIRKLGMPGSLSTVAQRASELNLKLAIELEPGPLYTVNSLDVIEELCHHFERSSEYNSVGFNLDIAHFQLAGITAEDVGEREWLRRRIFHAHISRHTNAHWCDLDFTDHHEYQARLRPWIQLLGEIKKQHPERYSGTIAVELEASASIQTVQQCLHCLSQLIRGK